MSLTTLIVAESHQRTTLGGQSALVSGRYKQRADVITSADTPDGTWTEPFAGTAFASGDVLTVTAFGPFYTVALYVGASAPAVGDHVGWPVFPRTTTAFAVFPGDRVFVGNGV